MALGPLAAVRVFTRDLARAVPFYRDVLGLPLLHRDASYAVFDTGPARLILEGLAASDPEGKDLVGRFTALSFSVGDIHGLIAALKGKGVVFDGDAEAQDWGGTLAHFHDLDGNILTLVQNPED